ncbi:retinoic acid-induced protein 2 [Bombina bombina]|uniref:retinoic acid-induced protein 2 n=1 Tax=Bombina bombina TaxID=8345 RepID=UPI00235A7CF5|nr:retinoic acid-induced protein 2 [Bombina bombina]XP_053563367.1 retinoic acid-induced protein 2 [Bombina bombina]
MEELYKDTPELQIDLNNPPSTIQNNKLENGVAQLITAEAWNINPSGLMKKALSPLIPGPAPSVLSPPSDSQSGVALKVAATVLQPICLGENPVVLPIHWQVASGTSPQMNTNSSTPYVITTQGPVPLPLLLEQHVFQHLNSPLVLSQAPPCSTTPIQNPLFSGPAASVAQPQILDEKTSSPVQEAVLPPVFQTPGFTAVLQDLFPSPNSLGAPSPCHVSPDYASPNLHSVPPQAFNSPLSPLVPPATLLVPYPVIVPLPVPVPIPIPIPIPMPPTECKGTADFPKSTEIPKSCKATQTPLEKEEVKPFELTTKQEFLQFNRHTVIKMSNENEALDLSLKNEPQVNSEASTQVFQEDGVLDLSVPLSKRCGNLSTQISTTFSCGSLTEPIGNSNGKNASVVTPLNPHLHHEMTQKQDSRIICNNSTELLVQQKWGAEQNRASHDPKTDNNIEIVNSSQTAKVIVSVKDAVPAIFCGKIKGVSTKNFSFKRDMPQDSSVQCYDVKSQGENRENAEALRKPIKNRSVKLKKVSSQEIHILPIKKQRLAAFFPRK